MSSQIREKISYSQVMPAFVLTCVVLGIMVCGIHKEQHKNIMPRHSMADERDVLIMLLLYCF
jgi:hypothetical protein